MSFLKSTDLSFRMEDDKVDIFVSNFIKMNHIIPGHKKSVREVQSRRLVPTDNGPKEFRG